MLRRHLKEGGKIHRALNRAYAAAARRALLLDYDGTLVPFVADPKLARPDAELINLLRVLSMTTGNEVVIVSGRPRRDLEDWFGALPVGLIAEHGVWLRLRGAEWRMHTALTAEWKDWVRPILQLFVSRLPGALLEEKEFSLAWHYRRADPEQAVGCSCELLHALGQLTVKLGVQVLEGNKVLEVRNTGVSKGMAAGEWLGLVGAEFVLAIGDDQTDEDLFRALPVTAHSVRVGLAQTAARYYTSNHTAVRRLLNGLLEQPGGRKWQTSNSKPGSGRMARRLKTAASVRKVA